MTTWSSDEDEDTLFSKEGVINLFTLFVYLFTYLFSCYPVHVSIISVFIILYDCKNFAVILFFGAVVVHRQNGLQAII